MNDGDDPSRPAVCSCFSTPPDILQQSFPKKDSKPVFLSPRRAGKLGRPTSKVTAASTNEREQNTKELHLTCFQLELPMPRTDSERTDAPNILKSDPPKSLCALRKIHVQSSDQTATPTVTCG